MGDFPDGGNGENEGTDAWRGEGGGREAGIWLHPEGVVESFPLFDGGTGLRRWVAEVREDGPVGAGTPGELEELVEAVRARCGVVLDPSRVRRHSSFRPERREAPERWHRGVILAGDAAHVVSPIGGQGMNLGWLNVVDAVARVASVLAGDVPEDVAAARYRRVSGRRARQVARRAEQNMWLACRGPLHPLRAFLVRRLLGGPAWVRGRVARRFTMSGIAG